MSGMSFVLIGAKVLMLSAGCARVCKRYAYYSTILTGCVRNRTTTGRWPDLLYTLGLIIKKMREV